MVAAAGVSADGAAEQPHNNAKPQAINKNVVAFGKRFTVFP
jgi:hypothetical protein